MTNSTKNLSRKLRCVSVIMRIRSLLFFIHLRRNSEEENISRLLNKLDCGSTHKRIIQSKRGEKGTRLSSFCTYDERIREKGK